MGLVTRALTSITSEARSIMAAYRTSPRSDPTSIAVAMTRQRRVVKSNPMLYRNWAIGNPVARAAIDIRKGQLETADWELVQFHRDGRKPDRGLMAAIREHLEVPNPADKDFGTFVSAYAEDLLVLDAGVIEKERRLKGEIAYLWPTNGGVIAVDRFWDGNPKEPRYYFSPQPTVDIPLLDSDIAYTMIHRRTDYPIGISYMETLRQEMDAFLTGMLVNARRVTQNAPDGIMDMGENARQEQVTAFKSFYDTELAGNSVLGFWGGTKGSKFIDFGRKNVEMQFMEWIQLNIRIVAIVFQLSPQDLGLLFDVNRASAQTQQENTEDRGQRTLLRKVAGSITSNIIWDPYWGGRANNIAFRFRQAADRSSLQRAETKKLTLAGMPTQSINEARMDLGWDPIGDPNDESNPYNKLLANTPLGLVSLDRIPSAYDVTMGKALQAAAAKPAPQSTSGTKPARAAKQLTSGGQTDA